MTGWASALVFLIQRAFEALAAWQAKQAQSERQAKRDAIERDPADAFADHFGMRDDAGTGKADKADAGDR
jgi:hypothetical protein